MRRVPFVIVTATAALLSVGTNTLQANPARSDAPTRDQVRAFLARLCFTPESACAAGLGATDVEPLFQAASEELAAIQASLDAADNAVDTARAVLAEVRSHPGDAANTAAVDQAQSALDTALTAQALVLNTAFDTLVGPLAPGVQQNFTLIRAGQRQPVSIEFKVVARTSEEWTSLTNAVQHVRARLSCGLTPAPDRASQVADAAADPSVSIAKSRLELLLTAVKASWNAPPQ